MTITYPVSWPDDTSIKTARFEFVGNTLVSRSPFTGEEQVIARQGGRWAGTFQFKPMKRTLAAPWVGMLTSLRGRFGTFNAYDPHARTPRGTATGTPLVNGGSQTGNLLITDGWTISVTGIMKAGDYFTVGNPKRLYMVVADVNSNGSGQATLDIVPELRESPANNDPLTVNNWTIPMRLTSDLIGWDIEEALFLGLAFAAEEAL